MGTYHYSMDELRPLHLSMRGLRVYVHIFDFGYNGVECKAMFQTDDEPYTLTFFKKITGEVLCLFVERGYRIPISDAGAAELKEFFEVRGSSGFWRHRDFIDYLKKRIPAAANATMTAEDRKVVARVYGVEESESVYLLDFINWEERNAKQPDPRKHKHRDPENLKKTKRLFPDVYAATKDRDISVCYTNDREKARNRGRGGGLGGPAS